MSQRFASRREFLNLAGAAAGAGLMAPYAFSADAEKRLHPRSKNDRFRIAAIGTRYQGGVIADKAQQYGDIVAICDVDREVAEKSKQQFGGKAELHEDYRKLLERTDIDVVTIGTPDHWHAAMLMEACRAGKDVYCEKPLTLTVDEGKHICKTVKEAGSVVQVGSWQRSDSNFRLACELARSGRLGKIERIDVVLGPNVAGGPFAVTQPPKHLNWDLWLGQTPQVPYIAERSHYTFRWWYEYSGGQMTDWGAHHLDIAQWALGMDHSGPVEIDAEGEFPSVPNGYNVATKYHAKLTYPGGVELTVSDQGRNGIMILGDKGRIFVNRGTVSGAAVEALKDHPLPREAFKLYGDDNLSRPPRSGKLDAIVNHMGNFFDCVRSRRSPISDVVSQHRSVTVCHLANISMRLGRKLRWNPEPESFVGDEEANRWLSREQRKPYQLQA